jgi:hypothetical protein
MLQLKKLSIHQLISGKPFWFCFLLLVTAASRLIVMSGQYHIYSWDAGNFALAADSFSLADGRPHLPGYFFHIQFIRMLTGLTGDHLLSMNLLSVIYSSVAAGFIFLVARRWFAQREAVLFTLMIIANPLVWYYGSVPEIYAFDLLLGSSLVWMGLSPYALIVTPSLMALGSGVRPSAALFLMPLYFYFWYVHLKQKSVSYQTAVFYHLPAVIILMGWIGPLVINAGSIGGLWHLYQTNNPMEKISIWQSMFRFSSYLAYLLPAVLLALIGLAFQKQTLFNQELVDRTYLDLHKVRLLNLWLWPAVLFFIFIHYSKGYLLICMMPLLFLLFMGIKNILLRKRLLFFAVLSQAVIFLLQPFHYPDPQVYFNPSERRMNYVRVWVERSLSEYAMTRSQIYALQDCYDFIEPLTDHVLILMKQKRYLFIDPTVMISTRALQAMFPQNYFSKLLTGERNRFGSHFENGQEALSDVRDMIRRAVIISRTDFVRKYLQIITVEVLAENDRWTAFTVDGKDIIRLEKIYNELFLRID